MAILENAKNQLVFGQKDPENGKIEKNVKNKICAPDNNTTMLRSEIFNIAIEKIAFFTENGEKKMQNRESLWRQLGERYQNSDFTLL